MSSLPEKYNSQEVEKKWRETWDKTQVYAYNSEEGRESTFSIDTPPPTVSGLLHMGHIFSYTQTDFIARYQRMKGMNVFYPMGFDDNGLPTERLVEKIKGVRAGKMPRADFIKICEEVVEESEQEFRALFKEIALSVDWTQEYQTISKHSRKISQMSFIDLFNKDLAYRKFSPTFWDPVDKTAIAQAEIEDKERKGYMNDIAFSTSTGEEIVIATTRPELIPACVAVFYNPLDGRYTHLTGKKAVTPIFNHEVSIIADESVNPEKGTGLVMCCTFGDIQDIEWWKKHNLTTKECISLDGKMVNSGKYNGLKVEETKKQIIEDLKTLGLLRKQEEVTQFVKCAERSGAPLEIIPTHQWYVTLLSHKDALIEKGRACNWYPDYMRIRLENWINGLNQDWCISRQRFFGVPFPAWYSKRRGEEGKILLADIDQLPVDPLTDLPKGYTREEVEPDYDVMDTWATSSISPQLNTSAITRSLAIDYDRHQKLYPFDLRPQAHEIIRTWGFYTIVKSLFHEDSIPWKNLMISGWCLASDKTKMSKSKGNVITPKELIIEKGSDVVRYWASTSKLGVDTAYSEELFKIGRKLVNKLWNASKFAGFHFAKLDGNQPTSPQEDIKNGKIFESLDLWILSELHKTIEGATAEFERFEYSDARVIMEDFFWNAFCDNYLELIKARAYDENKLNPKGQMSAVYTIYHCLKHILILFAPLLPHITEEINYHIFGGETLHKRGSWPKLENHWFKAEPYMQGIAALQVLELVRKFKSERNLSLRVPLKLVEWSGADLDSSVLNDLRLAANASEFKYNRALNNFSLSSLDGKYSIYAEIEQHDDERV